MVVVNQKSKITGACRFFNFNNCPLFNQITIECDFTLSLCLCVWLNLSFLDTYFSLTLSTSTHSLSPLTLAFTHKHFLFPSLSLSHMLSFSLILPFLSGNHNLSFRSVPSASNKWWIRRSPTPTPRSTFFHYIKWLTKTSHNSSKLQLTKLAYINYHFCDQSFFKNGPNLASFCLF